jgi:hypothetical protein
MGFAGTEEAAAASGLRTALHFYARKVDLLQQRQRDLEAELAAVQAELSQARTTRDQLTTDLDEILAQAPSAAGQQEAGTGATTGGDTPSRDEPTGPAPMAPSAGSRQEPKQGKPRASQSAEKKASAKSGEVMRAIEQLLATAGKPMHVKDLTSALGRPTDGKEGTAAIETIRGTCKRLVGHGRIAEVETAVFAIVRAAEAGTVHEPGPVTEAEMKGAA